MNQNFYFSCCAYRLFHTVSIGSNPLLESMLPGNKTYEMTQIFLDKIQEFSQSKSNELNLKLLSKHFPNVTFPSERGYHVEILFMARPFGTPTPFKISQSSSEEAFNLVNIFKHMFNNGNIDNVTYFTENWNEFVKVSLEEKTTKLLKDSRISLHYRVKNLEEYYKTVDSEEARKKYCRQFASLEMLFREGKETPDLNKFTKEWSNLSGSGKHRARNHDPFVRKFQEILSL